MTANRWTAILLLLTPALLAGCWTPPVATGPPQGPPGRIEKRVYVESILGPALVQSADPDARTIVLRAVGEASAHEYRTSRSVGPFDRIAPGKTVHAILLEKLTVYSPGDLPAADSVMETIAPGTKVLAVDRSYRLLTVQYATGQNETFKVGREVNLKPMQAGDDVAIEPLEVVALSAHRPWWR